MIPKFRAWNTKSGRFAKDGELFLSIDSENYNLYSVDFDNFRLENDNYILMQSTGLKDKNGVEIFEGDVVINRYGNYYTPIYQNGIYMAYKPDKIHKDLVVTQFNIIVREGCEVVGNIFEDGDLIDG